MEALGVSVSYGLEDRWASQGQADGVGGTGSTPSMGTSDLGSAAWECGSAFLPCFSFSWHLPEHRGELSLPACVT